MDLHVRLTLLLLLTAAALADVGAEEDAPVASSGALSNVNAHTGASDDDDSAGAVAPPPDATGVRDVLSLNTENAQLKTPSPTGLRNVENNTYTIQESPGRKMNHSRKKQRRKRLRLSRVYHSSNSSTVTVPAEKVNHTSTHDNRKQNKNSKTATEKRRRRRKKNREERRRKRLRLKLEDREKRKQRKKNERLRRRYRKERKRKLAVKGAGNLQANTTSFIDLHKENTTRSSLNLNNSTINVTADALKNISGTELVTPSLENPVLTTSKSTSTEKMEQDNSDYLKDDNFLKMQNEEQKDFNQNVDNILLPFATGPLLQQDHLLNVPIVKDDFEEKIHLKQYENHGPQNFAHTIYRTKQSEGQYIKPDMDENDTSLQAASSVNQILPEDSVEPDYKDFSSYETNTYHYTEEFGDLSCLNGTLLPAPTVLNSWIKYIRLSTSTFKDLLFAEYRCKFGYRLAQHSKSKLLCVNRRWVGKVPKCLPLKLHEGGTSFCDNNKGGCDQICVETEGKPTCLCFKGFTLNGTVCKDIDECATSNGGCEHKCQNSAGTYRCLCPPGLRLGDDQKSCIDINECLLRNGHGPCQDLCHNEWGSYKCSCEALPGTRLSSDNHTCEDEDECASGKAGCSHGCLNTLGNAFCLCPMGFMLGPDWKTCQDIDECEAEYLDAQPCELGCVNTVGSYHCRTECPSGWEITTSNGKRSCKDVDECVRGTSGCSHFCHNTEGGYVCSCRAGYMLAPDNTTCVDGAMRDVCPPLDIPLHGYVECARSSSVQPEQRHARVVNHAGAVCELRCPQGYRQRGEYRRVCGRDRKWQGPNSGHCIPWPVPVIQCPKNITYYLDPGRSTAYIEFPKPRTSVDWSRNIESFPEWGKDLEVDLPEGHWEVKFIARHPVSHHVSTCTFSINVVKRTFQVPVP